jgi:hypothetical protein
MCGARRAAREGWEGQGRDRPLRTRAALALGGGGRGQRGASLCAPLQVRCLASVRRSRGWVLGVALGRAAAPRGGGAARPSKGASPGCGQWRARAGRGCRRSRGRGINYKCCRRAACACPCCRLDAAIGGSRGAVWLGRGERFQLAQIGARPPPRPRAAVRRARGGVKDQRSWTVRPATRRPERDARRGSDWGAGGNGRGVGSCGRSARGLRPRAARPPAAAAPRGAPAAGR